MRKRDIEKDFEKLAAIMAEKENKKEQEKPKNEEKIMELKLERSRGFDFGM